jgi:hypothetical protein
MFCCSVWASRALLIGLEYIFSEEVVRCLSIAQRALVQELEPQSISQVRPCGQTMLKSGLKWSAI